MEKQNTCIGDCQNAGHSAGLLSLWPVGEITLIRIGDCCKAFIVLGEV